MNTFIFVTINMLSAAIALFHFPFSNLEWSGVWTRV